MMEQIRQDEMDARSRLSVAKNLTEAWVEFINRPEADEHIPELEVIITNVVKQCWGETSQVLFNRELKTVTASSGTREMELT